MRRLYVVTHPEATHQVAGLVGGWFDSELTARGLCQADAIAERLRQLIPTDAVPEIYSSDLTRTTQTAQAVGKKLGVPPVFLPDLREKSYGVAEGRAQKWLDERFVPPPATGDRMNHFEGIEGSETKRDLAVRIYEAVRGITESRSEHQVVVTHGFAMTFVVAAFACLPLEASGHLSLPVASGSITVLGEDDFFHNRAILNLNDIGHLEGL